jgi:hypothetical protein
MLLQWTNFTAPRVVTAVGTIQKHEQFVILESAGIFNLTMPPVAECTGREFVLWMRVDGGDVTVLAPDAVGWANLVFGDVGDTVHLYSDGLAWHATKSGVA